LYNTKEFIMKIVTSIRIQIWVFLRFRVSFFINSTTEAYDDIYHNKFLQWFKMLITINIIIKMLVSLICDIKLNCINIILIFKLL